MIVDIYDLNYIGLRENEDCTVLPINPETENLQMFRLQQLHVETRMEDILFEQTLLLRKFPSEVVL